MLCKDQGHLAFLSCLLVRGVGVYSYLHHSYRALGREAEATAENSIAMGYLSRANGISSVAIGIGSSADANAATALRGGAATGQNSLSLGGVASGERYHM